MAMHTLVVRPSVCVFVWWAITLFGHDVWMKAAFLGIVWPLMAFVKVSRCVCVLEVELGVALTEAPLCLPSAQISCPALCHYIIALWLQTHARLPLSRARGPETYIDWEPCC